MRKIILQIIVFAGMIKNNVSAQEWSALGVGIGGPGYTGGEGVYSLAIYNGMLYAGGAFDFAGGIEARGIAKWDGTNWSHVGTGNYGLEICRSLLVHNNELYAGGYFGIDSMANIARWNGTNWLYMPGVGDEGKAGVYAMAEYNGALYAAGSFIHAGGVTANNIARWNGTNWSALGSGIGGWEESVLSLAVYNGELYAGGEFMNAGGVPANGIAKWNGTSWSAVGTGMNNGVGSLIVFNGALYAGGAFTSAGGNPAIGIAKWDGNNWSAVNAGVNGSVTSFAIYNGALYAGGYFNIAGGIPVNRIAKWNGTDWSSPGTGITSNWYSVIYSVTSNDEALYVGGFFTNAGGVPAKSIAKWMDSCTSSPPPPGLISGNTTVCPGSSQTYFINPVNSTASYTWTLPTGWTGSSTTNTITVTAGTDGGIISVTANNFCGSSLSQILTVQVDNSVPSSPTIIYGNDTVCEGSSQTYIIDSVPRATGYAWDLTFGTAFGFDSTSITITPQYSGYPQDFITVAAYNDCGSSEMLTMPVKVNLLPQQPYSIIGNAGICEGSTQIYSISPVSGATSYTWILPAGWTGQSTDVSINVTSGNTSGLISVNANNRCGTGPAVSLPVQFVTLLSNPGDIIGDVYVTVGELNLYAVKPVRGATGYNWSLSGGGKIDSGQNPYELYINWETPGTYNLSVSAVNDCGPGIEKTVSINVAPGKTDDPYNLQLYPNPSHGQFYLKAKRLEQSWLRVEVLNMSGQLVFRSEKSLGTNDYSQLINLDKMPPGIYAVKIIVDDKVFVRQISIVR